MVVRAVVRDWSDRLANLERLVDAEPNGPIWLWRTRIRILSFLLARYGPAPPRPANGRRPPRPPIRRHPEPPPALPPDVVAATGVAHPPKANTVIRPILDDICDVNEERRGAEWINPSPQAVWTWWRAVWCVRPPR